MAHLLVVDDEPSICWGLSRLAEQMGHSVATAASAEEGLAAVRARAPDALVLDVRLPGMDGLSAMRHFRRQLHSAPIIVITAYGELATAVEAVRNGAFDYLTKPFDLAVAQRAIDRALRSLAGPLAEVPPSADAPGEARIVGTSPAMQAVFKRIALVAPSDACVHLRGESGTGKELVARAIHRYSRRSEGPFVAVNVASLSPSLVESELFGHVRGAFTGASQPRKGLLESAHGGTIFLDEVADVPLAFQVKLLRALERGEVLPVGGEKAVPTDFRIITATHQDLREQVAQGNFRHDLYFRLVTFEIALPPLRRRRGDIRELADYFLGELSTRSELPRPSVSAEALAEMERRPWYGNVRELRNAVEHGMIMARGRTIAPEHLPPPVPSVTPADAVREETVASLVQQWARAQLQGSADAGDLHARLLALVEPPVLQAAMEHYRGQCAAAARRLGLHRTTLRKKLDQFGLRDD